MPPDYECIQCHAQYTCICMLPQSTQCHLHEQTAAILPHLACWDQLLSLVIAAQSHDDHSYWPYGEPSSCSVIDSRTESCQYWHMCMYMHSIITVHYIHFSFYCPTTHHTYNMYPPYPLHVCQLHDQEVMRQLQSNHAHWNGGGLFYHWSVQSKRIEFECVCAIIDEREGLDINMQCSTDISGTLFTVCTSAP